MKPALLLLARSQVIIVVLVTVFDVTPLDLGYEGARYRLRRNRLDRSSSGEFPSRISVGERDQLAALGGDVGAEDWVGIGKDGIT